MYCPKCKQLNLDERQNCLSCGAPLSSTSDSIPIPPTSNSIPNPPLITKNNIPIPPPMAPVSEKSKRSVVFVVVGVLLLLGLGIGGFFLFSKVKPSVQPTQQPTAMQNTIPNTLEKQAYLNTQYGFKINMPRGWQPRKGEQHGAIVSFLNPKADQEGANSFSATIGVNSESALTQDINVDNYTKATREVMLHLLQNYKSVEDKAIIINGMPAKIIGSSFVQNAFHMRTLQLITIKNGKAYTVTGMALESVWDQYKDLIESSLLTFTLN